MTMKPPSTKGEKDLNYNKIKQSRDTERLHSNFIRNKQCDNQHFKHLLHLVALAIYNVYLKDSLKAPMGNPAAPALFSKPAVNVYFAQNQEDCGEDMKVASYGFGKGLGSIGLNPETLQIHGFFSELLSLTKFVSNEVNNNKRWKKQMQGRSFDTVSVKLYYSYKRLKTDGTEETIWKTVECHTDVTYQDDGVTAKADNSQLPGTPVAMVTFGSPKNLWFRRHLDKDKFNQHQTIHFLQETGKLFVLDGEDERKSPVDGWHWRHKSTMRDVDAVTFSFMFRVSNMSTHVKKESRLLSNPKVGPKKRKQFQEGEHIFKTEHYNQQCTLLVEKMEKFFLENKH